MPVSEFRPSVSILIAARNEAPTILACLQAIDQLDYPADLVEVLIGNDQSTDQTADRVTHFIADKPRFRLYTIDQSVAGLAGKANVLAQLARHATGDLLFFTDADTQVPTTWLLHMSQAFAGTVGVVTGITLPGITLPGITLPGATLPIGPAIFHKLQGIDWLYNLTLVNLLSNLNIPVTAMGNNMAVSRAAYEAVGGYESLPFSVVEDYTLFQAITKQGFGFRSLLNEQVLASTKAVDTLLVFLQQRKRWMRGATALPGWMVVPLYLQYLLLPLFLLLGWLAPGLAITLYLARFAGQTCIILHGLRCVRKTKLWPYALLFEIYQLLIGPLAVAYYLLPIPIQWKGRRFA
ncbi:glycosyltransferase [Spirosoma sp. KUDC1026]|uniref:glycosyltransferase n=1 Tax=Spirosoma sp. KUDC1026 TaxID=2745947 RepID=UPI00159B9F14|nr:glycosyltransferase [Spirosoma sp. KUDC1026]QKZ14542.1 glycosyltransferase [Spirosoma sp. KUDC1026]